MKAAVINAYGNPDVFEVTDLPLPEPGDTDVLINVMASGINPVDWKIRKGNHKYTLGTHFPIVLGFDASGEVVKTGKKVTRFKPGDKVYGRLDKKYGRALAEYALGSEGVFDFIPEKLSFEEAASIPLAAVTALQALRDKGKITKGMDILIIGATGGVGHFAVQLARHFETKVTAVVGPGHDALLKRLQPDSVINYKESDFRQQAKQYDIIFDAAGKTSYPDCRKILKKGGCYITTLPRPKLLIHKLISIFSAGKKVKTLLMKSKGEDLAFISGLIKKGQFFVKIDKTYPLEAVTAAHQYAERGHTEGKVVIRVSG
ncbi:MAG: NADP-dependent oxidoreductase [Bacteroidota bacterium]